MDDKGFGGRYPGGPRRSEEGTIGTPRDRATPPAIESVGEIEERAQTAAGRRTRDRRSRRVRIGLLIVIVAGGAVGLWMGLGSYATPEEIVEEMNRENQPTNEEMLRRELIRLQSQPQQQQPAAPRPGGAPGTRP